MKRQNKMNRRGNLMKANKNRENKINQSIAYLEKR